VTSAIHEKYLAAEFSDLKSALLTARRLQWTIQGFSEADPFAGTALAVLVHSSEDLPGLQTDQSSVLPLERAAPGQMLLTPKTAELLRDLPGLPLQAAVESGLQELLWRGTGKAPSRSSDEEAISQLIRLHGLESEAPAVFQQPGEVSASPRPTAQGPGRYTLAAAVEPAEPVRDELDVLEFLRQVNPRWMMGAAGAVMIVLVMVVIFAVSHKKAPGSAAIAVQPGTISAAPISSAGVSSQAQATDTASGTGAVSGKQGPQTERDRGTGKAVQGGPSSAETSAAQANKQRATGGKCDLDANLIPKALDQAEKSRDQGNYAAAERQFRSVLACEPENARARGGLERVLFAKQTEK
jgi:hypothetical protein